MPNKKTHGPVSTGIGVAAALLRSDEKNPWARALIGVGGGIGGYWGGRMPDLIDPPTSPNHRSWGHGVLPVSATFGSAISRAQRFEKDLLRYASNLGTAAGEAETFIDRLLLTAGQALALLVAGAIPGFAAGYVSHLALDLTTAKRLPLVR